MKVKWFFFCSHKIRKEKSVLVFIVFIWYTKSILSFIYFLNIFLLHTLCELLCVCHPSHCAPNSKILGEKSPHLSEWISDAEWFFKMSVPEWNGSGYTLCAGWAPWSKGWHWAPAATAIYFISTANTIWSIANS